MTPHPRGATSFASTPNGLRTPIRSPSQGKLWRRAGTMTRRTRKALLSLGAVAALVMVFVMPVASPNEGIPADGRWLAVGKADAAARPQMARRGSAISRTVTRKLHAAVPVSQPRPLLIPTSKAYTRTGSSAVALTFDDGPDPRWTPQVLGLLRKYQIKATFCLIGGQARAHPALVKQIVREGHSLCNHTMRHDEHLKNKSAQRIAADLAQTSALIKSASGGIAPRFFRAPGGNWSTRITAVAASQHMQSLGWAVDPQDWRRPPAARIITTVERTTRAGSVILMHDAGGNRAQTVAALRTLLPYLKAHYRLVAL
jgi:peptidoglycan/xylan/chitin deacetylase (PgdA/CDA1 family)